MTRIRLLQSCAMACLISSISACGGDAALAFGYGCEVGDPSACASGVCEAWSDGTTRCTAACSTDVPCPVSLDDSPEYTCNPARGGGLCDVLCTDGALVEDDNATYVCLDSEFFDCGEATAAEGCSLCGCEPYGGGVCVPGTGCVEPAVNGTVCSDPRECISGTCGYATMICQDPAALAAPCFADEDCASRNCSNDGNHAIEGVCNMPFGEICEGAANCNRCVGANAFHDGWCVRGSCNPADPAPCATAINTGGEGTRDWVCRSTMDGGDYCFETCRVGPDFIYNCLAAGDICHEEAFPLLCY
jgi:hypothetical protein